MQGHKNKHQCCWAKSSDTERERCNCETKYRMASSTQGTKGETQKHRKKYEQAMTPTLQPLHIFSRLENKNRMSAWTKKLRIKLSSLLVWLLELTKESIAWKRGTHIETRAKSCRILYNASCLKFNVVLFSSSVERWIGTRTSYFRVVGMIRREAS